MSIWDDTFTGTDNDPPDSTKWIVQTGSPVIISNTLRIASGTNDAVWSKYSFPGDFDVSVDFDVTGVTGSNYWTLDLMAYQEPVAGWARVSVGWNNSAQYMSWARSNSSWGGGANAARSTTTGKIRLTRGGSTFHHYWWNGTGWTELGTGFTPQINVGAVQIILTYVRWGGSPPAVTGYFDNFLVNSGDPPADGIIGSADLGIAFAEDPNVGFAGLQLAYGGIPDYGIGAAGLYVAYTPDMVVSVNAQTIGILNPTASGEIITMRQFPVPPDKRVLQSQPYKRRFPIVK